MLGDSISLKGCFSSADTGHLVKREEWTVGERIQGNMAGEPFQKQQAASHISTGTTQEQKNI